MVLSSSGHGVWSPWPIAAADPALYLHVDRESINRRGACVFYDELSSFSHGYCLGVLHLLLPPLSLLLIFVLSAQKQLHRPLPRVSSCK